MRFARCIPFFILQIIPKKLEGQWYQLATNDPTIPTGCKCNQLIWKWTPNEKEYDIKFYANCYTLNVNVDIHGIIQNNTMYDNFKPFQRVNQNKIINVIGDYEMIEILTEYNIFHMFKKRIYQLLSRRKIPLQEVKTYIHNAENMYNVSGIRVIRY